MSCCRHSREAETAKLRRWKAEAMQVLGDWHSVWEAAGKPGRLGQSQAAAVADRIKALEAELSRLRGEA